MFVDGGWRPFQEPPSRKPKVTDRQERILLWLIMAGAFLLMTAPIAGVTIVQALVAVLRHT